MTGAQGKWENRRERGWGQTGRGSSKRSMEASRRGRRGSEDPRGGCCSHSNDLCGWAEALGCRAEVWGVDTRAEIGGWTELFPDQLQAWLVPSGP